MALEIDAKFEGIWSDLKNNMKNLANFHSKTENSDFILESETVELNKNKQPDQQDALWKLYYLT